MKYFFWDIQNAPPVDDASAQFPTGFRGEQAQHFRWVAHQIERIEVKMVPSLVHFLWGPPCMWPAQVEGTDFECE